MQVMQTELVGIVRFRKVMLQRNREIARFYVVANNMNDRVVVPIGFLGHDLGQAERRFGNSLNRARAELLADQDSGT